MSIYDRLALRARPVVVVPDSTSYFSDPTEGLDPRLFDGDHFKPGMRNKILSLLYGFWQQRYANPESWSTVWIAGSGVSYQWSAARDPGDLDCLVGVDMVAFRQANPDFVDLSDAEIATNFNEEFRADLMPFTSNWNGYELTFFVNQNSADIRDINPYAAYNLSTDEWTVRPDPHPHPPMNQYWQHQAEEDSARAQAIAASYNKAVEEVGRSLSPGQRLNSSTTLRVSAQQAADLFDVIHEGRHAAFAPGGKGYGDFANYRWQAGKASGAIQALKKIKDVYVDSERDERLDLYGTIDLDPKRALVRAALANRYRG